MMNFTTRPKNVLRFSSLVAYIWHSIYNTHSFSFSFQPDLFYHINFYTTEAKATKYTRSTLPTVLRYFTQPTKFDHPFLPPSSIRRTKRHFDLK